MLPDLWILTSLSAEVNDPAARIIDQRTFLPRCCQKEVKLPNYYSSHGGETMVNTRSDTFCLHCAKVRYVVECGMDQRAITAWNVAVTTEEKILEGHIRVVCAVLSWKIWLFSVLSNYMIMIWDLNSGQCEKVLQSHSGGVSALPIRQDSLVTSKRLGRYNI
jgi:WD40 repeat protein